MIATAILLFAQVDPLPPPPPPEPGQKFQPAEPAPPVQPTQPAQPTHSAQPAQPRRAPAPYRSGPPSGTRQAPAAYEAEEAPEPVPMPRRGFQLGVRTGVALPAGRLSEGLAMDALAAAQVPLFLDIGAKISRYVFLGGYASFALGGVSDRWDRNSCRRGDDCSSRSAHLGAQVQIHFGSFERANPWIGYGLGYEWLWTAGNPETTYRGWELGRFMAGLDFRLSRDFGLGPFVDATIAQYSSITSDTVISNDIAKTALHSWVTVGIRFVLFP